MSKTKEQARVRNWNKMRLMGIGFDERGLTEEEIHIATDIRTLVALLRRDWDEQSEIYLGHALPPFKCASCGKRSSVEHLIEGLHYCPIHYKLFKFDSYGNIRSKEA